MHYPKLEKLLSSPLDFDIQQSFAKAWGIYKSQVLLYVSFMMLLLSLQGVFVLYLREFTLIYSLLLAPALYAGFYLVANKASQGMPVAYGDFLGGFGYWFLMVSIWMIGQILVFLGLILLVIPGVYLAVSYMFAVLFGLFGGFDFWNSLEFSRRLVGRNFWKFFTLATLILAMNLAGTLFIFADPVGAILFAAWICVSIPMTFLVTYVVFEELTKDVLGEEGKEDAIDA